MSFTQAELEKKLAELIDSHNVPGAQLAVLDGDTITEVAAGVLSLRTGSPVTTDALFLPGSIGKLYTATLVLMLADEGLIDLDEPVRTYLPDFEVRDQHARDTVTVRNLLTHTSGFDGDVFIDTGRGDDALERYITEIADLPQICEPGKIWSYSNSGFSVLGRLIEVVWDTVYETALRDRLLAPLGLEHSVVFPEDVIPHPNSVGHVPTPRTRSRTSSARCGACTAPAARWAPRWSPAPVTCSGSRCCTSTAASPPTAPGCSRPTRSPRPRRRRSRWSTTPCSARRGVSAGSWTTSATSRSSATTGTRWARTPSCASRPSSGSASACRPTSRARCRCTASSPPGCSRSSSASRRGRTRRRSPRRWSPTRAGTSARYQREGLVFEIGQAEDGSLIATIDAFHAAAEMQDLPPMVDLPLVPVERDQSFLLKLPIADSDLIAAFFNPDDESAAPTYLHFGGRAHKRVV